MFIGNRKFNFGSKCYIMGVLNVTPDSFSDGGMWQCLDVALRHVEMMINDGADIIDVGGESTRPGYESITVCEEIDRVLPIVEALNKNFDVPISIDTYKSAVARAAIDAGAVLVNDIWGFKHDADMASVVARNNVACCLMHNRKSVDYISFIPDMLSDLNESVRLAIDAGIAHDKIILDPGIGFAKTYEMNLEAINRLDEVVSLGFPVLLGVSRKSVIGLTLDLPVTQRVEGTIAAVVIGIMRRCSIVRVHDVKEVKRAVKMAEASLGVGSTMI
jgi:dihydropteroate synthase